jgi:hypothetical protein
VLINEAGLSRELSEKILKFFVADPDPAFNAFLLLDPGSESQIRHKYPGSATLECINDVKSMKMTFKGIVSQDGYFFKGNPKYMKISVSVPATSELDDM